MTTFNSWFEVSPACDSTTILAHELRNPLATIDLSLKLMLAERKDDELKGYMDIIKHSADRINDLVNEMIKNHGVDKARFTNQSLHHLLDEVVEMAQDRIMLENITVCKEYDRTDCMAVLNRPKMKIALTNIIVNAIEAMDSRPGELKLTTMSIAGKQVVQIEDNGCGISEKNLKNIFRSGYTNKPGGRGIGLATTHGILASNNVKVHVESQEGSGTQFLLIFDKN